MSAVIFEDWEEYRDVFYAEKGTEIPAFVGKKIWRAVDAADGRATLGFVEWVPWMEKYAFEFSDDIPFQTSEMLIEICRFIEDQNKT